MSLFQKLFINTLQPYLCFKRVFMATLLDYLTMLTINYISVPGGTNLLCLCSAPVNPHTLSTKFPIWKPPAPEL